MRAYKTKAEAIEVAIERLKTLHSNVDYLCIVKTPDGYGVSDGEVTPIAIVRRGGRVEQ